MMFVMVMRITMIMNDNDDVDNDDDEDDNDDDDDDNKDDDLICQLESLPSLPRQHEKRTVAPSGYT